MNHAERFSKLLNVPIGKVQQVYPRMIQDQYQGVLSAEELKVALQTEGEDGWPVYFWRVDGNFYLDDPTFTDHPVNFSDLRYDEEIGLFEKES